MPPSQSPDSELVQEGEQNNQQEQEVIVPDTISVLPLRNTVVYPSNVLPLVVERPGSIQLIDDALAGAPTDEE